MSRRDCVGGGSATQSPAGQMEVMVMVMVSAILWVFSLLDGTVTVKPDAEPLLAVETKVHSGDHRIHCDKMAVNHKALKFEGRANLPRNRGALIIVLFAGRTS
ncbi:hypothetical protein L210DRAFT_3501095 [Boletus edulis BED1]|uniref:Uncharacterized protein n=1 Tax=Boletus edulis BED1 TaxID=1328754 RepID=A0AAD4C474_BOLED|nr:hypothetical protein L210DRAFT_3501095 [Boletus edulis BED1]